METARARTRRDQRRAGGRRGAPAAAQATCRAAGTCAHAEHALLNRRRVVAGRHGRAAPQVERRHIPAGQAQATSNLHRGTGAEISGGELCVCVRACVRVCVCASAERTALPRLSGANGGRCATLHKSSTAMGLISVTASLEEEITGPLAGILAASNLSCALMH